jgi:hypothetical protein
LLLTWGSDPATEVTVSWSAPGTVAQPAPTLAFSTQPITAQQPGWLVKMPDPKPLDVTERYGEAASVSFTDGLNGQTTYFYHVQLTGLKPGTRYYYQVSDGAHTPSTAGASFETAPHGRAKFRFSSYGDLATPSWDLNTSGNIWHESCDNSWFAVTAIENPGTGRARRSSTCLTATFATPTWTSTTRPACGGTSATTSRAARRTGRGCLHSATTSVSSALTH